MTINLELNEAQANALLKMLDSAVRYDGLQAAPTATELFYLIQQASQPETRPSGVEVTEDE
jgi:hypothetical protein